MSNSGLTSGYISLFNISTFDDVAIMDADSMTANSNLTIPYVEPYSLLSTDSGSNVVATTITNTNANGNTSSLSLTGNTLTMENTASQDLSTGGSPTFYRVDATDLFYAPLVAASTNMNTPYINLQNATQQIVFTHGTNVNTMINSIQPATSNSVYNIIDAGTSADFIMTAGNQTLTGEKTFSTAPIISTLTPSQPVVSNSSNQLVSGTINLTSGVTGILPIANGGTNSGTALTNGKIMISSGGQIVEGTSATSPSFTGITLSGATTGTLLCTDVSDTIQSVTLHNTSVNGANSTLAFTSSKNLTLAASNVQDISPAGSPTFESLILTNTTNQLTLGAPSFDTIITAPAPAASRTYTLPDAGANANIVLTQGTQTIVGTTYFDDLRCSVISAGALVFFDGTGPIGGISLAAGQLPIGQNASTWPIAGYITGTTNQIIVTNGSGSITLSTPQSIGTSSVPTFGGLGTTGSSFYYSKINTAYTGSTTILVADLLSRFFQFTANTSGVTLTFPTGTALETGISATITPYVGMSFDCLFWNYNSNAVTVASNTGIAFQIMSTSQPGQTARMYRIVRTGTDTYTVYNLS